MYKKKIEQYIEAHKQEMLDDICTLCSINSERSAYQEGDPFGEGPSRALAQALKMAEEYGFSINNYDNYVGTADLNDGEHQLDILAHLDVVPAGEGWTVTQPFEPIVKDGKLYGRGTADDKGPAVAALYAMRAVKELGIPVTKNVRLILGTDEECGSSDIEHYYKVEKEAPMTFSPDASFPVINIEKGRFPGHVTASFEVSTENARILSIDLDASLDGQDPRILRRYLKRSCHMPRETSFFDIDNRERSIRGKCHRRFLLHFIIMFNIAAAALLICSQNQAYIFCHRDSQFFDRTHRIQSCYRWSLVIRRAASVQLSVFYNRFKRLCHSPALACRDNIQMCQNI